MLYDFGVLSHRSLALALGVGFAAFGAIPVFSDELSPLAQKRWFEARTTHFHTYSCGSTPEVARLAAHLEQFHQAYAALAGAQAVTSPPIVVLAFPDHDALREFLPRYDGKPANLAGFFIRSSDENLIVMSLAAQESGGLETILHEYAHLLLRRNQRVWPLWLNEGMADIYATFEVTGEHTVRIGRPMELYLEVLARRPLMSLRQLCAVTHDSSEYNERERQGIFYAESWLLTHYLMCGASPDYRARFGGMTGLLRLGQFPEQALTNSFRVTLTQMEAQLRAYLERGRFVPQPLTTSANLLQPQPLATRGLTPVETLFRLGDELLRLGRFEEAERYFSAAQKLAPASALGYEGMGLLAGERGHPEAAAEALRQALQLSSKSFLAHFVYAREKFRLAARSQDTFSRVPAPAAAEIRTELERSLELMPEFGPAHHLLGVLEFVQGENRSAGEAQLARALQLEPENQSYALTLAQAQLMAEAIQAARQTLEPLCLPNADPQVRVHAEELLERVKQAEDARGAKFNR